MNIKRTTISYKSAGINRMGNFEFNFANAHEDLGGGSAASGGGANSSRLGAIVFPINDGERSSSPTSPSIAIPEKKYTPAQDAVLNKFIDFVKLPKNDKPYLTEPEKLILKEIYYWRETQDILKYKLRSSGIQKEKADLNNNYTRILKRRPGFPNSRSRKSRNRKQRKTRKQ